MKQCDKLYYFRWFWHVQRFRLSFYLCSPLFQRIRLQKANYALFIQQKEFSNWKTHFYHFTICNMLLIFYFSSQNAEQSTQTSAWFYNFYHSQCISFVNSHILQFMPCLASTLSICIRTMVWNTMYYTLWSHAFYMLAVMNGINLLSQEEAHRLQTYALILAVLYPNSIKYGSDSMEIIPKALWKLTIIWIMLRFYWWLHEK